MNDIEMGKTFWLSLQIKQKWRALRISLFIFLFVHFMDPSYHIVLKDAITYHEGLY